MATYQVVGTDGSHYQIEGPDNVDPSDVIKQVTAAHRPQSYDSLGNGQVAPTGSPAAHAAQSPVSPSGFQNFLAGAGKATYDLGRGAGQYLGLESRADIAQSRAQDAPLMQTGAGRAGMITGTVADMLPTAFIPGANTMLGAAAIGAGSGAVQPSASTGETFANTGLGGLAGPVGLGVGRAVGVGYNTLKSVVQPFFNSGQDAIAASTLRTFAGGEAPLQQSLQNVAQNSRDILPGVQPMTAELANNAGIAQLSRQMSINPDALQLMTTRNQANRAAMTGALGDIAGNPSDLATEQLTRSKLTAPLYSNAQNAQATSDEGLQDLLGRPSLKKAWDRAQTLAEERGDALVSGNDIPEHVVNSSLLDASGNPFSSSVPAQSQTYSGKALQYLKMSLNDIVNQGEQKGMGAHELGAMKQTLGSLNNWIGGNVPALKAADESYSLLSQSINQMQIGQKLSDKLIPALGDFGNNTRLSANNFANAIRQGDSLAAGVTGYEGSTLENTLSPSQLKTVMQVGQQLARRANADELGKAVGSNTAQNLVSQNLLRQVLGPMGLPQSWGEGVARNTLAQTILRPAQFVAEAGEKKVLGKVANAVLSPVEFKRLAQLGVDPTVARAIWARQGLFGTLGTSGALLGNSPQ
jgi:hypothetical protein